MDSRTSQIYSSINLQEMFKKLDTKKLGKVLTELNAKKLGKKGIQQFNENSPLLMDVTKSICEVAGPAPLVGICFQALGIIIQTAEAYMEIYEKAKEIIEYASSLQESMELIENAGEDDEYLKQNCVALLCAEAFEFQNQNARKQSRGKCMCGLVCAKCEAQTLDGLATRLKDMTFKLSLHCHTVLLNQTPKPSQAPLLLNQTPKPCQAPLGDSSLKLNNKEGLLKFVTEPGIRVLALCGMGGLGKTRLLTALHQDFPEKDKQAKIFIEVGRDPANFMKIQTKILQGLESKNKTFENTEQGRARLKDCLKDLKEGGSSLCLSLDNVWRVEHLKELLPRELDDHLPQSSCLMISTRSHRVAKEFRNICCPKSATAYKLFQPNLLDTEEAELLFIQCARIQNKNDERNLINEIVPLCGGLPLAIQTYGSLFRSPMRQVEAEWTKVKQQILTASASLSMVDSLESSIDIQASHVQDAFIDAALFWRGQPLEMARSALYNGHEDILEVLLEECIFYSKEEGMKLTLNCHDLFFAIAQKHAQKKGWKYVTTPKMQGLQEGTKGIHLTSIHQNLEFQTIQNNLLFLRCDGALTCGLCNTSQDKKHHLKALELSQRVDLRILQCFPDLQLLSIGGFEYGIESTQAHCRTSKAESFLVAGCISNPCKAECFLGYSAVEKQAEALFLGSWG